MSGQAVVWALPGEPPCSAGEVLLWRSYAEGVGTRSVPRYLESHAERLRAKYLEFIHDLGEREVDGKTVVEHLDLGDGFSLWWMTRLAEKSPFKSPQLYDCLRLMALEEILVEGGPLKVVLHGATGNLAEAVEALCRNLGIGFVWHSGGPAEKYSLRRAYLALPQPVQGLISLRHVVRNWRLRRLERPDWFSGQKTIFFCSYFFNLDATSSAAGRFQSNQWGGMPAYLQRGGWHANWVHHFLRSPGDDNDRTRMQYLNRFNRDAANQGCHSFLESHLSWGGVGRALWKWLRLVALSLRLRSIRGAFAPRASAVSLWPLLRSDWLTSLRGPTAFGNCLWVELFDALLKDIPRQKTGLYLWENQGWECALLNAWRKHGHGRIIGVPHATVVFWHLNNFDDPRTLDARAERAKPLPDHLAINGPMARRMFEEAGCSMPGRFVEVEALRFQYLAELARRGTATGGRNVCPSVGAGRPKRVLILGDFTEKQTLRMLSCMAEALRTLPGDIALVFKPHPLSGVGPQDFPSLSLEAADCSLSELLPACDLVFSGNSTSAGLEALLAGLPVLVFLDDGDFNHSPLRGVEGVVFVGTASDLAAALTVVRPPAAACSPQAYFWLDQMMPRWHRLLAAECEA